jgi:cbb3-type cytochrome c oxidase subunit III
MGRRAKCAALLSAGLLGCVYWSGAAGTTGAAGELVQKRGGAQKSSTSPAALFASKCARCHGNDGRGETAIGRIVDAPDLTDAVWWGKRTNDRALVASVTKGRGGMPAFGKKLTQKEIASLVAYARSFKK